MRISDWSSDVCSSDLDQAGKLAEGLKQQWQHSVPAADKAEATRARILADWGEPFEALRLLLELCRQEGDAFNITSLKSKHPITRNEALARLHIRACRIEIGRASCRESVCHYG